MIETPISDWNVVVGILFGLTASIPLLVVGLIKLQIFIVSKLNNKSDRKS